VWVDENSAQGTALNFNGSYLAEIRDDDIVSVHLFITELNNY
jgi:hypothetical protein